MSPNHHRHISKLLYIMSGEHDDVDITRTPPITPRPWMARWNQDPLDLEAGVSTAEAVEIPLLARAIAGKLVFICEPAFSRVGQSSPLGECTLL